MSELLSAIQRMKRKGVAGPDNIPQITWSFSSPGTAFLIQRIIPTSRMSTDLKSHYHNPFAKSWEITE